MAYSIAYQRTMDAEKAREILDGYSGLTMQCFGHPHLDVRPLEDSMEEALVSIEGTDGNVYTGVAKRSGEKKLNEGNNLVFLSFRFGENQSRVPLENKVVREFGFAIREMYRGDSTLVYVPETGRFVPFDGLQ